MLPPDAESLDEAHAAIDLWQFYSGKTLDPTQRLAVEVMLATRDDGTWAAATTGREMPRQNGKGDEIEVVEFWGLVKLDEAILHTIHDAVLLATRAQERMLSLFDHPDLRHLIDGGQVWKGSGQQMIRLSTGGQIWYRTRTGGGGRGVDQIDRLVVDEAQHATEEQLAAVSSTLMAARDPQLNAIGTAALEGKSAWWWNIRKRALSPEPGAFGYVGHTAETVSMDPDGRVRQEFPDVQDRQLWRDCNPALSAGRGRGMAFLEEELWQLGEHRFAEEHLCVWAPEPDAAPGPIDAKQWADLTDANVTADDVDQSTVRLAIDAPPDRRTATFVIAAKLTNGLFYADRRDHLHPERMRDLSARAKELCDGHGTDLLIPAGSPALAWKADLEAAGVTVDVMPPAECSAAFGYLLSQVNEGTLRHRGQPELNNAVAGLTVKRSGDVDVPARRTSSTNIAPFIAAMCALYRVPTAKGTTFFAGAWK